MAHVSHRVTGMVAGAALMSVAWCGTADAVQVDVPWAGPVPNATSSSTPMFPAPNVANVIKFLGISGTAEFYAGEGGTGNVYATVGGVEYLLVTLSPGEFNSAPLANAAPQNMAGTLTAIRLEILFGGGGQDFDEYRALQLFDGEVPTLFSFETSDNGAIPEPASILTFLFGLAGLGLVASGRRQQAARASV